MKPLSRTSAWLLAQGPDIVPIPGTKSRKRLEEHVGAAAVTLGAAERARLDAVAPPRAAVGDRYPAERAVRWE